MHSLLFNIALWGVGFDVFFLPGASSRLIGGGIDGEDDVPIRIDGALQRLELDQIQGTTNPMAGRDLRSEGQEEDSNPLGVLGKGLLRTLLRVALATDGLDTCPRLDGDVAYHQQLALLAQLGYEPFFAAASALSGGDGSTFPGPGLCTKTYLSHEKIKQRLADLPGGQHNGTLYRGNELGLFRLGSKTFGWCEDSPDSCGMVLGMTASDHEIIRPLLDELFGDGRDFPESSFTSSGNRWTKADFVESATDFLKNKDALSASQDASVWAVMQLHKTSLGIVLTEEQAGQFVVLQGLAFFLSIHADMDVGLIAKSLGTSISAINAGKASLAQVYSGFLKAGIGAAFFDVSDPEVLQKAAYAILDSFLFAGGLSVPAVIQSGLAAYFTGLAPEELDMTSVEDLKLLALESIRLYPPVLGASYIEASTGRRHVPLPGYAGLDRSVYGEDAGEFRIRGDLQYYHSRSLNWAEAAVPVDGKPFTNHVCPGRSMSFNMIIAFWEALDATGWRADPAEIQGENGPTFWSDFTLTRIQAIQASPP